MHGLVLSCALLSHVSIALSSSVTPSASFDSELKASVAAVDATQKIAHLSAALQLRPNNPANLPLQFQLGNLLSQEGLRLESGKPGAGKSVMSQALDAFSEIPSKFDHQSYYSREPSDTSDNLQMLVPRACVLAGSIQTGYFNDGAGARKYVKIAMDDLQWTYVKRKQDWSSTPKPVLDPQLDDTKFRAHLAIWERRIRDAATGDVLSDPEMVVVNAAVREFGYSFGPQRRSEQVEAVMRQISVDYPETPLAKVAQSHIKRAARILNSDDHTVPATSARTIPTAKPPQSEIVPPKAETRRELLLLTGIVISTAAISILLFVYRRIRKSQ